MIEAIASFDQAAGTGERTVSEALPLLAEGLSRMARELEDQLAALSEFRHVTESRLSRIENGLLDLKHDLRRAMAE